MAFVLGGAYFDQPYSSQGAFTRGSVLFNALLTTCLDAFGEMPTQMMGRPILMKQTGYRMYRPAAITLGNTIADVSQPGVTFDAYSYRSPLLLPKF